MRVGANALETLNKIIHSSSTLQFDPVHGFVLGLQSRLLHYLSAST